MDNMKAAVLGVAAVTLVGVVGYIGYKVGKGDVQVKVNIRRSKDDTTAPQQNQEVK